MKILVKSKHNETMDKALIEYTEKKLEKINCHADLITNIDIIYSSDNINKIAEAKINVTGSQLITHASCKTSTGAMDLLIDKIIRQIIKFKEKHNYHHA